MITSPRIRRIPGLSLVLLALMSLFALPVCAGGELLIKWRDGPASAEAAAANATIGSQVRRNLRAVGWQIVKLPEHLNPGEGVRAYRNLPAVLAVEANCGLGNLIRPVPGTLAEGSIPPARRVGTHAVSSSLPNDPRFSAQWYLRNIGATNAWTTTTGSSNVVVAVLDTGVDYTHPDLAANMWRNPGETGLDAQGNDKAANGQDDDQNGYVDDIHGIDASLETGDPRPRDYYGGDYHGTSVAGIIAAVGNNGVGITGINWSSQIMAIGIWSEAIESPAVFTDTILAAFDYIIEMKRRGVNVRVMNCGFVLDWHSAAIRDAIIIAGDEDILAVFVASNAGVDLDLFSAFPGGVRFESGLCVAASTPSDELAWFSGYGASTVDLAAPGVDMVTTGLSQSYRPNFNGTSGACPLVVGAAALLLSKYPTLTIADLKAALLGSVDPSPRLKGKVITHGRLNVSAALDYLASTPANRPAIVIHASPAGHWNSAETPIRVTFNRPMSRSSVESAFTIHPPFEGAFAWDDDNRAFSFQHELPFDTTTNYTVRILGTARDESGGTLDGNFDRIREGSAADDFVWGFRFPIPNDDFATAESLVGEAGALSARKAFAWLEMDEPISTFGVPFQPHSTLRYGGSLWYRWTPAASGWTTFDLTMGTTLDSLLAVFTGDSLDSLTPVASNDNYGTRLTSRVSFEAVEGTNYSVFVATKTNLFDFYELAQVGSFRLMWYPTPAPGFTGAQFSPKSAAPGQTITLTGTNFTGARGVLFNGVAATTLSNASSNNFDLRITAIIPPGALPGPITVLTPHGNVTTTAPFEVLPPRLSLANMSSGDFEVSWNATSDLFLVEASDDLIEWRPSVYLPEVGTERSTLRVPVMAQQAGFFRLTRKP